MRLTRLRTGAVSRHMVFLDIIAPHTSVLRSPLNRETQYDN
jgi:hypothetical protein